MIILALAILDTIIGVNVISRLSSHTEPRNLEVLTIQIRQLRRQGMPIDNIGPYLCVSDVRVRDM